MYQVMKVTCSQVDEKIWLQDFESLRVSREDSKVFVTSKWPGTAYSVFFSKMH